MRRSEMQIYFLDPTGTVDRINIEEAEQTTQIHWDLYKNANQSRTHKINKSNRQWSIIARNGTEKFHDKKTYTHTEQSKETKQFEIAS